MEALVFVLWQLLACSKIIGKFQIKNRQSLFTFCLSSLWMLDARLPAPKRASSIHKAVQIFLQFDEIFRQYFFF